MSTRITIEVRPDDGPEDLTIEVEHPVDHLPAVLIQGMIQRAANAAQAYLDQPDDVVVAEVSDDDDGS